MNKDREPLLSAEEYFKQLKTPLELFSFAQAYAKYHTEYHLRQCSEPKNFEIDFGGNVLAGIEINNNIPFVFGAMNGYGDGISIDRISIKQIIDNQ